MTKSQIKKTETDIPKQRSGTIIPNAWAQVDRLGHDHRIQTILSLGQLLGSQALKVLGQIHQQGQRRLERPPTGPPNHHRSTKRTAPARGLVTKSEHMTGSKNLRKKKERNRHEIASPKNPREREHEETVKDPRERISLGW
ncbi:hypothetical protein Dimus_039675 [Dionaea muscipula]